MAGEASSRYTGNATELQTSPLPFQFQAGQPERATSKHSGRHAKSHKHHASPFRGMPGFSDKPFATFPPSTGPAVNANGMHPGAGASSTSSPPVHAAPVCTAFLGFPPSPGHHLNGVPLSPMPSSGAGPDAAAQLPPRFAAAVNISEGASATSAQRRVPNGAATSARKSAARRRGHLSAPGGNSPSLREGSPMDWSPSVPAPAPALTRPAGLGEEAAGKDDGLDGLHADFAASSLSGDGNRQQAQLSEAFSSRFSLGSRAGGQPGSQAPSEEEPFQPQARPQPAPVSDGQSRPSAEHSAAHGAIPQSQCAAAPRASSSGNGADESAVAAAAEVPLPVSPRVSRAGETQSAGSQPTVGVPRNGSLGGESLGGRSMSEDSSADSGLPRDVLHRGMRSSPADKGHGMPPSHMSHVAKQMRQDASAKRPFRQGMTLGDISAAAKAHSASSRYSATGLAGAQSAGVPGRTEAPVRAGTSTGAASRQANGFMHVPEGPTQAPDPGDAWRAYGSSRAGAPRETRTEQASSKPPGALSGTPTQRQRPATADLDEYLFRQHTAPSGGGLGASQPSRQSQRPRSADRAGGAGASSVQEHAGPATENGANASASSQQPAGRPQSETRKTDDAPEGMPMPVQNGAKADPQGLNFEFGQQGGTAEGSSAGKQQGNTMPKAHTQDPSSDGGFRFEAAPAAADSSASKARPEIHRSPKRATAQAGRPVYRPGAQHPFVFSAPPSSDPLQQPAKPSSVPPTYSFGSSTPAESSQPQGQPSYTTMGAGKGSWPPTQPAQTFPMQQSGTSVPSSCSNAAAAQQQAAKAGAFRPSFPPPSFTPAFAANEAKAPWECPAASAPAFSVFAPGTFSFGQAVAPAGRASGSFTGFKPGPQPERTPQQEQAAAQGEPVFMFGDQRPQQGPQEASAGSAAAQMPSPGSARARGFPMGSQNSPPAQSRRSKVRLKITKQAKHQQPVAQHQPPPQPPQDPATPKAAAAPAAEPVHRSPEQDSERLRQRGNEHFGRGSYTRAADLYQRAIKQQSQSGTAEGLGKLYCNLAACHLQLEQYSKAIQACQMGLQVEPSFHKSSVRLATCHMRLGEPAAARGALEGRAGVQVHADVAAKLAEVEEHASRLAAATALAEGADSASTAEAALSRVDAMLALDQAPGSQQLRRLKAQLLFQLSRFEDAASLCRPAKGLLHEEAMDWHWWLAAQAAFHTGDLQQAVRLLSERMPKGAHADGAAQGIAIGAWKGATEQKGQQRVLGVEDAEKLLSGMQRMLHLRELGNRAVKESKMHEAIEHYSKALELKDHAPSIAFAAILHQNRAAARQSLDQHAEAIADCLRATALKQDYAKAHSRLAALLRELKHHSREVDVLEDLQPLVKGDKIEEAAVARRLREARVSAKSGTHDKAPAVDHYKVLGVERSVSAEDVRKAYLKSALQLHPDKAVMQCRFAIQLGSSGLQLTLQSEVEGRVREKADWLFKCVAEAYSVLTDSQARLELDSKLAQQERQERYSARRSPYKPPVYRSGRSSAYGGSNFGSRAHRAYESNGARSWYHDETASPYDDCEDCASNRWNYF